MQECSGSVYSIESRMLKNVYNKQTRIQLFKIYTTVTDNNNLGLDQKYKCKVSDGTRLVICNIAVVGMLKHSREQYNGTITRQHYSLNKLSMSYFKCIQILTNQ